MSLCTNRHKTFVRIKPTLQQSVTRKTIGTWRTDCTFKGRSSLSKSVPNPKGSTSSTATAMPKAEKPQVMMCKHLRLLSAEACSRILGRASPSFTMTRIQADATTTPILSGRKSEICLAWEDKMHRTISLPRASGRAMTRAMTDQQHRISMLVTPKILPRLVAQWIQLFFRIALPVHLVAASSSGSSVDSLDSDSPTNRCPSPTKRNPHRSSAEISFVITGEVSSIRMHWSTST
mmetsp:Transcript_38129/g.77957  ORF Transcript_38129/g.77957 Transcript_38129/m.77957 type:complete len:234 (+) Transcript_38129:463-1164(+)